jgi:hypothetical protein
LDQQVVRRLPPVVWVLRETTGHEAVKSPRYCREQRRQRRRVDVHDRGNEARLALALKRLPAGQHLVEHDAEREDVGPGIDAAPFHLLGRHVANRAENHSRAGQIRLNRVCRLNFIGGPGQLGQAEVEKLNVRYA